MRWSSLWLIASQEASLGLERFLPQLTEKPYDADGDVKKGEEPLSSCQPQLCLGAYDTWWEFYPLHGGRD